MKKKLFLVLSIFLSGCNMINSSTNNEIEVVDMINRKVNIKSGSYSRVVCIGAGALRMYSYIGDVNKLCGVEDIDNDSLDNRPKMFDSVSRPYFIANKDVFNKLPSCGVGGPNAQSAEAEKILSCKPDIIISEYEDVSKADALQKQVGVPVITLRYGSKGIFDDNVKDSLSLLGKVFNQEDRANELNNYINNEKETISNRVKNVTEKKKVYICGLGNWGTTDYLMTAQNYEPFNVCNIDNVINDLPNDGIQKIEKEKFVSLGNDIDIMIIDAAAVKNIKPLYKNDNTIFSSCKAWNNNEVYLQMAYNAYYTNLETALINTWFNAKVVYPSLFSDIEMNAKTNEVTNMFLNKELANQINSYPNSFGGYQKIDTETFFA